MRNDILVAITAASVTAIIGVAVISVMRVFYYEPKPIVKQAREGVV